MNVKQGDLAIQIKSAAGNSGRIVRVLQFLGAFPFYDGRHWHRDEADCWLVEYERPIFTANGHKALICPTPDAWLRPISGIPEEESTDTNQPIKEPA
jgi:hypothetical protein